MPKFTISQHVAEATVKKAMSLLLFLRLMYDRDSKANNDVPAESLAKDLAAQAGRFVGVSGSFVYKCYKEWRMGQEELAIEAKENGKVLESNRFFF